MTSGKVQSHELSKNSNIQLTSRELPKGEASEMHVTYAKYDKQLANFISNWAGNVNEKEGENWTRGNNSDIGSRMINMNNICKIAWGIYTEKGK